MPACIRLRNVTKRYSGSSAPALDGVSFDVEQCEVVTIVGPSGCGKSTLLRIVAGLDFPDQGTIEIQGKPMNAVPARHRDIAMVFQSYALYPHLTCLENLTLHLRLKRVPEEEIATRVQRTATLLEIGGILHKKPKELSGGQRQRVAVGRALIRDPQAFLFDEPLSNLDAMLRERVRHELKELFRKIDATVVYVTHDQVEAMTLADRVVVLDRGKIQQIGSPEELYRSPANRFVASFIGSPGMNFFENRFGLNVSEDGVLGVRPEHIALADSGIDATVKWVENLGAHYLIGVQAGGVALSLTSAVRPDTDHVHIQIKSDNIHVFEKNSGANLALDRTRGNRTL